METTIRDAYESDMDPGKSPEGLFALCVFNDWDATAVMSIHQLLNLRCELDKFIFQHLLTKRYQET